MPRVREVEVTEDLVPHRERHPEEAVQHGMVGRAPDGARVAPHVRQTHGSRIGDEHPQEAEPHGGRADAAHGRLVHSYMDELVEPSTGPQDSDGAVRSTRELDRRLDDLAQCGGEVEVLDGEAVGLQEA